MLSYGRLAAFGAVLLSALLFACIETSAQQIPKDIAARTEIYAIPSLTISDHQFLTGDSNGKPVTVGGEFKIAQGTGRLPVVPELGRYRRQGRAAEGTAARGGVGTGKTEVVSSQCG